MTVWTHFWSPRNELKKSSNWLERGWKRVKTCLNWFGWNVYPLKLLLLPTVSLAEISRSSSGEIIKGERNLSKSETPKFIILSTFKSIDFRQWWILLRRDSKLMFPDGLWLVDEALVAIWLAENALSLASVWKPFLGD